MNLAFQLQVPFENTIKFGGLGGPIGREFFVWTGCSEAKHLGIHIRRILTLLRQWGRGKPDREMSSQVLGVKVRAPILVNKRNSGF